MRRFLRRIPDRPGVMIGAEQNEADRNGMNGAHTKRLAQLSERLASARQADMERYRRFFMVLGERRESARVEEREQDRLHARRFNAFDYLRTDELGLSQIIADLLNPNGPHGQGASFLERFRNLVGSDRWPADGDAGAGDFGARVERERVTHGGRFLDISVELTSSARGPACIAIENKPYAADGECQSKHYLKFLKRQYGGRFLLIYLSRHGGLPSEESLPRHACKDGLAVMSFCPGAPPGDDEDASRLRLPFALTDWLQECLRLCDVERLRWFLHEFETFCHKTFGGIVTTASEKKEVRDFILASEDNFRTALAVVETWPCTRKNVVGRFLEVLRKQLGGKLHVCEDLQIHSGFSDSAKPKNGVWAFRQAWRTGFGGALPLVCLNHDSKANGWFVGVCVDPGTEDADAKEKLTERLRERLQKNEADLKGSFTSKGWSWYRYLEKHRRWEPLLAHLHRETQEPDELTDYFCGQFVEPAKLIIPIIDEVLQIAE